MISLLTHCDKGAAVAIASVKDEVMQRGKSGAIGSVGASVGAVVVSRLKQAEDDNLARIGVTANLAR